MVHALFKAREVKAMWAVKIRQQAICNILTTGS